MSGAAVVFGCLALIALAWLLALLHAAKDADARSARDWQRRQHALRSMQAHDARRAYDRSRPVAGGIR